MVEIPRAGGKLKKICWILGKLKSKKSVEWQFCNVVFQFENRGSLNFYLPRHEYETMRN